MPNDVKLQEGHPVDENLRPIKVGGKATALETAQHGNGARINGDLSLTGRKGKDTLDIHKYHTDATATTLKAVNLNLIRTGNVSSGTDSSTGIDVDVTHIGASGGTITSTGLDIDVVGDASATTNQAIGTDINVSGADIATGLKIDVDAGTSSKAIGIYIDNEDGGVDFKNVSSANKYDFFTINTIEDGETTLTTVEQSGTTAHLNMVSDGNFTVDAVGDISLDSATGNFIAKDDGTEFSVSGSAYAGTILGYRCIGEDAAPVTYTLTTSMVTIHSDATVRFIAPPSGNVEINFQAHYYGGNGSTVTLGISDNATYSALSAPSAQYEKVSFDVARYDDAIINQNWVVTSLVPGNTYNYWIGAKTSSTVGAPTIKYGGDSAGENVPLIIKVTALPAATSDFAVYG